MLATNRPADLDSAVLDRIDEAVEFRLPCAPERLRLLHQYFQHYVGPCPGPAPALLAGEMQDGAAPSATLNGQAHAHRGRGGAKGASAGPGASAGASTSATPEAESGAGAARSGSSSIAVQGITTRTLMPLAADTEGMSGREIAKLLVSVQSAAYGSDGTPAVDAALLREVVVTKVQEHARKRNFGGQM